MKKAKIALSLSPLPSRRHQLRDKAVVQVLLSNPVPSRIVTDQLRSQGHQQPGRSEGQAHRGAGISANSKRERYGRHQNYPVVRRGPTTCCSQTDGYGLLVIRFFG